MKAVFPRLRSLVPAALVLLAMGGARADQPERALLSYPFQKGQDWVVTIWSSTQQNQLSSGQVVSEGIGTVRQIVLRCKVEEVNPNGDASIAIAYARIVGNLGSPGFVLSIDSATPVAKSNPEFAATPQAKDVLPKLEQVRSAFQAMIGLSYKFTVSKSGKIIAVEGFDDVMDHLREQIGARTQDLTARAQIDTLIEAMAGDGGRRMVADFFLPYPASPVAGGETWSSARVAPCVVNPVGQWKLPETMSYVLEYGGEPGRSAVISGDLTFGAPDRPGGAELELGPSAFSYYAILDAANGGTMLREFHSVSKLNLGVYTTKTGAPRTLAGEFQLVNVSEVYWDPATPPPGESADTLAVLASAAKAAVGRGNAKLEKGDFPGAIADYDQALILNSREDSAANGRDSALSAQKVMHQGAAKFQAGDWAGAIASFSEAIKISPSSARAYLFRGVAWHRKGDDAQAVPDYNKALELDWKIGNEGPSSDVVALSAAAARVGAIAPGQPGR